MINQRDIQLTPEILEKDLWILKERGEREKERDRERWNGGRNKVVESHVKDCKRQINSIKGNWTCRIVGGLFSKKKKICGYNPYMNKEETRSSCQYDSSNPPKAEIPLQLRHSVFPCS